MPADTLAQRSIADFAADVRWGLAQPGQKELSSKYFYDEVGTALFEVITRLPEYGLCRADERLLGERSEEIVELLFPGRVLVAELGSGSGKKTRWILEALARRQETTYHPIEISRSALTQCVRELGDIQGVTVAGFEQSYLEGLLAVAQERRLAHSSTSHSGANGHARDRLLVLFLGSTIGNFGPRESAEFLGQVRRTLQPGDALLLGADLVKPLSMLLPAYDDPLGVTASFNLNLLARINRELGACFDLDAFRHVARYHETERRIEMHLQSLREQSITIDGARCTASFSNGETIWTESSYKYYPEEIVAMGFRNGFRLGAQWLDQEWPFAQTLLIAD